MARADGDRLVGRGDDHDRAGMHAQRFGCNLTTRTLVERDLAEVHDARYEAGQLRAAQRTCELDEEQVRMPGQRRGIDHRDIAPRFVREGTRERTAPAADAAADDDAVLLTRSREVEDRGLEDRARNIQARELASRGPDRGRRPERRVHRAQAIADHRIDRELGERPRTLRSDVDHAETNERRERIEGGGDRVTIVAPDEQL
ncbi:MAG TPA: hypothetical protein VK601_19435, partial [Kofleriaceae bacterium]|nr:hypothetical protein [Kofleriaceae bacterium]